MWPLAKNYCKGPHDKADEMKQALFIHVCLYETTKKNKNGKTGTGSKTENARGDKNIKIKDEMIKQTVIAILCVICTLGLPTATAKCYN